MRSSYFFIKTLSIILLISMTSFHVAESSAIEVTWASSQSGNETINRLYGAKSFFFKEEEETFYEIEELVKSLSGVGSSKTLIERLGHSEDFLSQIQQMFKLFSMSEQYLVEGIRAVLAYSMINHSDNDETAGALVKLFGNWSPFLDRTWYSSATINR